MRIKAYILAADPAWIEKSVLSLHGGSTVRHAMRSVVTQRLRENLRAVKNHQMTLSEAVSVIFRAVRDHALRRYGVMHP